MSMQPLVLLMAFLAALVILAYPLGLYIEDIASGARVRGFGWLSRFENMLYRVAGVRPDQCRTLT